MVLRGGLRGQRAPDHERQPHIHGARAGQCRSGIGIANVNQCPPWEPGMVRESTSLPYTASEYVQDVQLWVEATSIEVEQSGALMVMTLGGNARLVADASRQK